MMKAIVMNLIVLAVICMYQVKQTMCDPVPLAGANVESSYVSYNYPENYGYSSWSDQQQIQQPVPVPVPVPVPDVPCKSKSGKCYPGKGRPPFYAKLMNRGSSNNIVKPPQASIVKVEDSEAF